MWRISSKKGCAGRLGDVLDPLEFQVQWLRRQSGLEP
jgi:hypothetical protein